VAAGGYRPQGNVAVRNFCKNKEEFLMTWRSVWLSFGVGLALASAGWALPSGEVTPGGGLISYSYQIGGLGELDDSGHHLDLDFGVTEQMGAGLSVSRMSGKDRDTGLDIDTTIGSLYGKYQLLEAGEEHPGAVSAYLGYHWISEQDETFSGVGLGVMGSAYSPSGLSLHGRLGVGTRPGDDVIEFELGAAWALRPELDAIVGLRAFRAGEENEGGLVLGLVYRFAASQEEAEGEPW
jgi:hypothetical protein